MLIHRSWFEKSRLLAIIDIQNYEKYVYPRLWHFGMTQFHARMRQVLNNVQCFRVDS